MLWPPKPVQETPFELLLSVQMLSPGAGQAGTPTQRHHTGCAAHLAAFLQSRESAEGGLDPVSAPCLHRLRANHWSLPCRWLDPVPRCQA